MANEEVKSGLWQIIKSYVPKPIILIILLYIGVVAGGIAIYNTVTGNDKLDEEFIKTATNKIKRFEEMKKVVPIS